MSHHATRLHNRFARCGDLHNVERHHMNKSKTNSGRQANAQGPKRPWKELRLGALKVVVWENETRNGPMFSSTLVRIYKDENDQWQETHAVGVDDLLAAAKLLDQAHTAITREMQDRAEQKRNAA